MKYLFPVLILMMFQASVNSQTQQELLEISSEIFDSGEHQRAIELLELSKDEGSLSPENYIQLSNFYSVKRKPVSSYETLMHGISKYPTEGILYYEAGKLKFFEQDFNIAISLWEDGILADPEFPGNYYEAARLFGFSDELIWTVIYAEIFFLIAPDPGQKANAARIMFDAYSKAINIVSDSVITVSFSQNAYFRSGEFKTVSFESFFENVCLYSLTGMGDSLTVETLINTRTEFIDKWFKETNEEYDNILFNYKKKMADENLLTAYNYHLFGTIFENEFKNWYNKNRNAYERFLIWFKQNPFVVNRLERFNRFEFN